MDSDGAGLPFKAGVGVGGAVAVGAGVPAPVEEGGGAGGAEQCFVRIEEDIKAMCGEVAGGGGDGGIVAGDEAVAGVIDGGLEIEEGGVAARGAHGGADNEGVGVAFFKAVEAGDEEHIGAGEGLGAGEIGIGGGVEAGGGGGAFGGQFGIDTGPAAGENVVAWRRAVVDDLPRQAVAEDDAARVMLGSESEDGAFDGGVEELLGNGA